MSLRCELQKWFDVAGYEVLLEVVAVPAIVLGLVQVVLLLLHRAQLRHEVLGGCHFLLSCVFMDWNGRVEGDVRVLIFARRSMEAPGGDWGDNDASLGGDICQQLGACYRISSKN